MGTIFFLQTKIELNEYADLMSVTLKVLIYLENKYYVDKKTN